jgi:hypothetical protein
MTGPLRPAFHEGQILAATDLASTVEYARGAAARHARLLHDWGIADGLGLVTEARTDPVTSARYVQVSVAAGMAVDGTGREVLVPEPVVLRESAFEAVNGADRLTNDFYPVFLTADDREPVASPLGSQACGAGAGATRVEETYQVLFGRLGDERLVDGQTTPPTGASPASPPVRWLILLGYVQWTAGHFTGVVGKTRDVGPRYVGVRADTVAARSGELTLRSGATVQEGQPAVVLSGGDTPGLVFGLYRGDGGVEPLMTLAANGNLEIQGSFKGGLAVGAVEVGTGTATDGMLLPLPAGITPEQVADGRVALHLQVTPRVPPSAPPSPTMLPSPVEATVDGDRRVRCRVRWFEPGTTTVLERPGAVDFQVLATVAAATEGG